MGLFVLVVIRVLVMLLNMICIVFCRCEVLCVVGLDGLMVWLL